MHLAASKGPVAIAVLAGAVGVALRLRLLDAPVTYDEAFTYLSYVSRPLSQSLADYSYPNNHPAFTALAHWSIALFGDSLTALRMPSLVCGVLLLPLLYAVTTALLGSWSAAFAVLLASVSPELVRYSALARGYSLESLCAVLACAGLLMEARGRVWGRFVACVSAAIGLFTLPTFMMPLLSISAFRLLMRPHEPRPAVLFLTWAAALGAALYLPILLSGSYVAALDFTRAAGARTPTAAFLSTADPALWAELTLAAAGFAVLGRRAAGALAAAGALGALTPSLLIGFQPLPRLWLVYLLPAFATAGSALARLKLSPIVCAPIVAAVSLALSDFTPRPDDLPNARAVAEFLAEHTDGARPIVATDRAHVPLAYEMARRGAPLERLALTQQQRDALCGSAGPLLVVTEEPLPPKVRGIRSCSGAFELLTRVGRASIYQRAPLGEN